MKRLIYKCNQRQPRSRPANATKRRNPCRDPCQRQRAAGRRRSAGADRAEISPAASSARQERREAQKTPDIAISSYHNKSIIANQSQQNTGSSHQPATTAGKDGRNRGEICRRAAPATTGSGSKAPARHNATARRTICQRRRYSCRTSSREAQTGGRDQTSRTTCRPKSPQQPARISAKDGGRHLPRSTAAKLRR